MKYIDITYTLEAGMKKYPTDPDVKISSFKSFKKGNSCNLSKIALGTHSGTHIDAPYHIFNQGGGIDEIKLEDLFCDVIVTDIESLSKKGFFERIKSEGIKGIVLKTSKYKTTLTPEKAEGLVKNGIKLIGTDQLSIEESLDKSHPVHRVLLSKAIIIIENLYLDNVSLGNYKLICFPLKIKNGDGSPVRAILIDES